MSCWVTQRPRCTATCKSFTTQLMRGICSGWGAECGFPMTVAVVDLQVRLGLRALRWAGAFAQMVANSILAGSKFCNAYARSMFYDILSDVHARMATVVQHVDDLAQCAAGRQTVAIKKNLRLLRSSPLLVKDSSVVPM